MATVKRNGDSNAHSTEVTDNATNGRSNETSVHRRIFFCTHGRTASNLLMTLFAKHPALAITDYNFHNAFMFGPERLMNSVDNIATILPPERLKACENATYQRGFDGVQAFVVKAEAEVNTITCKSIVECNADTL